MAGITYSTRDGRLEVSVRRSRAQAVLFLLLASWSAVSAVACLVMLVSALWGTTAVNVPGLAYCLFWPALFGAIAAAGVHVVRYGQVVLLSHDSYVLQYMRGRRVMGTFERPIPPGARFSAAELRFLTLDSAGRLKLGDEASEIGRGIISTKDAADLAARLNSFLECGELTELALQADAQ